MRKLLPVIGLFLFLALYFYRISDTLDYPFWDETYYMRRGLSLAQGDVRSTQLINVSTSPLMPILYSAIYSVVRGPNLYPYAVMISVGTLAIGCLALLSRFINPHLALGLTIIVVISSLPVKISNIGYYFGAGLLWAGLATISKTQLSRGVGLLVVAVSIYVRPEFLLLFIVLTAWLVVYEYKSIKADSRKLISTVSAYLPVAILMGWTLAVMLLVSPNQDSRTANAIPWSYGNYLIGSNQTDDMMMGGDAFVWFERDFGKMSSRTILNELVVMTKNLQQASAFIAFNTAWMFEITSNSFLTGWTWKNDRAWYTGPNWIAAIVFWLTVSAVCYMAFRVRRPQFSPLRIVPLLSLTALIPWLMLVNPDQRTFMIFPLLVVPLGYALTILNERLHVPKYIYFAALIALILFTPRPFDTAPQRSIRGQYDTIKQTGATCASATLGETFYNLAALDNYKCR